MTTVEYQSMNLDELRRYMLAHREDQEAFQVYVDRSKAEGRMVTLNMDDPNWEEQLTNRIQSAVGDKEERLTLSCFCRLQVPSVSIYFVEVSIAVAIAVFPSTEVT